MSAVAEITQSISPRTLLIPEQAAAYLSVKLQTLANWRSEGRGPKFVRVGKLIRYRLGALDAWIESQSK